MRDAGQIGDRVLLDGEHDAAGVDAHDVVGDLLEVARDVAGHEDAVALIPHVAAQDVERFLAGERVEPGGGLVEDQQVGVVCQRASQRQLHAHAAGEVLHRLALRQLELCQALLEVGRAPGVVAVRHELAHRGDGHLLGERAGVEHHARALLGCRHVRRRFGRAARWSRHRGI